MFTLLFLLLALCVQQIVAVDPVVDLGYAKYRGTKQGDTVIRWAGMRYAKSASRVDGMRFAAPQDPVVERLGTIIDADRFGSICIGTNTQLKNEFGGKESEDCLFANVFAPASATNTSALPVYVFIQGGGFNVNGNANYNGTQLINAADGNMVVVNFNYRVGPYGFLASKEIADDPSLSLNNGLKDQRQLLKWVQDHIRNFGGDPNHVTLGGASAGAGSVVLQLTAYGGRNDSLFNAVFAESPAFPPMRNVSQSQFAYDALLQQANCTDLQCLSSLDAPTFQSAVKSLNIAYPAGTAAPIYFWNPTLDYDFIRDYTYNEIAAGHFVKLPTVFGDTTNEGDIFTPKTITSQQRAEQFLMNQFTTLHSAEQVLSKTDPERLKRMWAGPKDLFFDREWMDVASDIYGHIRYTCGGLNMSAAYARDAGFGAWQYRWNVGKALHVGEIGSIWNWSGRKGMGGRGGSKADKSGAGILVQGFFVSFVRSYDPNKHMVEFLGTKNATSQMAVPSWEEFGEERENRMVFNDGGKVGMQEVEGGERDLCGSIAGMGVQLEQATAATSSGHQIRPSPTVYLYRALIIGLVSWWCGS